MDEDEIAEKFSRIVEDDKLTSHPHYRMLINELDAAALRLFSFMNEQGHGDIATVHSHGYCGKGHLHELFRYTCVLIEEGLDDERK